jgi:glycosyltransferase involved in cell wall biosynthesis
MTSLDVFQAATGAGSSFSIGLSVVIPCLNESETIERAVLASLEGIRKSGLPGEVVVADNGSTDGSQEIAVRAGARVVPVSRRGYGAALDAGIRAARFEYVVFGDADLSYPLQDADQLIQPLKDDQADMVLGTRLGGDMEKGAMPHLNRVVGTPVLSFLIRSIYSLPTSDCNSGMRGIRRSQYERLSLACPGMEYASEMLIRAAQINLRYREVPIRFQKDQRNRPPHLKRWRDGWRHLRYILGNASSAILITVPGVLGLALMAFAFLLSFGLLIGSPEQIHFHTAFVAISAGMPFLLFAAMNIVVRFSLYPDSQIANGLLGAFKRLSDRAAPFYVAAGLYALGGLEVALMVVEWIARDLQGLFEIGGVIRLMIYTSLATVLFATDLATGLVRLGHHEKHGSFNAANAAS